MIVGGFIVQNECKIVILIRQIVVVYSVGIVSLSFIYIDMAICDWIKCNYYMLECGLQVFVVIGGGQCNFVVVIGGIVVMQEIVVIKCLF